MKHEVIPNQGDDRHRCKKGQKRIYICECGLKFMVREAYAAHIQGCKPKKQGKHIGRPRSKE